MGCEATPLRMVRPFFQQFRADEAFQRAFAESHIAPVFDSEIDHDNASRRKVRGQCLSPRHFAGRDQRKPQFVQRRLVRDDHQDFRIGDSGGVDHRQ